MCLGCMSREVEGRAGWLFSVSAHLGTYPLTDHRNEERWKTSENNTWGRFVDIELGYALLAVASLVEAAVRVPLTLLAAAVSLVCVAYTFLRCGDLAEALENAGLVVYVLALSILVNLDNALVNVLGMIQNPLMGEEEIKVGEDLQLTALFCCYSSKGSRTGEGYDYVRGRFDMPKPGVEIVSGTAGQQEHQPCGEKVETATA